VTAWLRELADYAEAKGLFKQADILRKQALLKEGGFYGIARGLNRTLKACMNELAKDKDGQARLHWSVLASK
jgi:hypothetical protein